MSFPLSPSLRRRAVPACGALWLALAAGLPAQAGPTFPPRKAGLWEMQMSQIEGTKDVMTVSHCVDANTDKLMQEYGNQQPRMNRKACKEETRNEAGKMMVHREVCQEGSTKVSTHIVMSGDFNSHYTVQSTTTYDPPDPKRSAKEMRMEASWKGACAAGQRPGDMIVPGGMKMNILDLMKMAPQGGARK